MSDIYIDLIRFGGQSHASSFLIFFFLLLLLPRRSMLFLAGDITQWHLPVGMKDLNLRETQVTNLMVYSY